MIRTAPAQVKFTKRLKMLSPVVPEAQNQPILNGVVLLSITVSRFYSSQKEHK